MADGNPLDKRQMRGAFNRAAAHYDGAARLQREVAAQLLERLEVIRVQPQTILDIGCGTGYLCEALARRYRNARIFGVDIAEAMVRQAGLARAGILARAQTTLGIAAPRDFLCGDAEALPLADASVDMVLSNLTLQWCDARRVFAEVLRVRRPGGVLMFSTFGPDTLKELRAAWTSATGCWRTGSQIRYLMSSDCGSPIATSPCFCVNSSSWARITWQARGTGR